MQVNDGLTLPPFQSLVHLIQWRGVNCTQPKEERGMKVYRIAAIPGDGIGKEVVPAGQKVLDVLATIDKSFGFEFENFDWGGDYYRTHGVMMPDDGLDALRDKDAIL